MSPDLNDFASAVRPRVRTILERFSKTKVGDCLNVIVEQRDSEQAQACSRGLSVHCLMSTHEVGKAVAKQISR
jgi:hypothetical protein